jgi:multidrug efflux pump subunit AcrA (membrane-fusion protein)
MKRLFFWVLLAIAVFGAIRAIQLVLELKKPVPTAKLSVEPPKAPFEKSIGARGLVESVDENIRISPSIAALVMEVPVTVGQMVKKGDVLIKQDTREPEAMVAAQGAEIVALKAQIAEAEVALADKRDRWDRIEKMKSAASEDERQRTKFAANAAEAMLATTRAKFATAEAQLERMKVQVDLLTVRALRDGRVLQVNVRPGEFASPQSKDPALLIGRDEYQIRADIDEDNASRFSKEMSARAYIKGRRDIEIPLRFSRIEPYILPKKSLTGESGERVDTRVLQVIYQFDRPSGAGVFVGQQMDVFLDAR